MATAKGYGNTMLKALGGELNWVSDTIKVMLCTSGYIPDQDAHIYKSSVTNEVASGNGYTTRGTTLANKTIGYTAGTNVIKLDADDALWSNSSITARTAVIYKDTGVDATSLLIGYVDFSSDFTSSNGDFKIAWDTNGILAITVA